MSKLKLQISLILYLVVGFKGILWGAFGCLATPYRPDSYEVSNPKPQACNCPCVHILDERGQCARCHHFGLPERGKITRKLLAENLALVVD